MLDRRNRINSVPKPSDSKKPSIFDHLLPPLPSIELAFDLEDLIIQLDKQRDLLMCSLKRDFNLKAQTRDHVEAFMMYFSL